MALPVAPIDDARLAAPPPDRAQVTWLGHACFLLQVCVNAPRVCVCLSICLPTCVSVCMCVSALFTTNNCAFTEPSTVLALVS